MKLKKGRILPKKEQKSGEFVIKKKKYSATSKQIFEYNRNYFNSYPKLLYDKNHLTFCLKEIELFLVQNGYKKLFPLKSLFHYRNKEFFQMFFFLFKKFDRNYKIETGPEDNILNTLKILGYPIHLTKSTLVSPMSPHSSQTLFHCLNWIIELCLYDTTVIFEKGSVYSTYLNKTLIWNRMIRSYNIFLSKRRDTNCFKKILKITMVNIWYSKNKNKNKIEKMCKKLNMSLTFMRAIFIVFIMIRKKNNSWKKVRKMSKLFTDKIEIEQMNLVKYLEIKLNIFMLKKLKINRFFFHIEIDKLSVKIINIKKLLNAQISRKLFIIIKQKKQCSVKNLINVLQSNIFSLSQLKRTNERTVLVSLIQSNNKGFILFDQSNYGIWSKKSKLVIFKNRDKTLFVLRGLYNFKFGKFLQIFFTIESYILNFRKYELKFIMKYLNLKKKFNTYSKLKLEKIQKYYEINLILIKKNKRAKIAEYLLQIKQYFGFLKIKRYIFFVQTKKLMFKIVNFLNFIIAFIK